VVWLKAVREHRLRSDFNSQWTINDQCTHTDSELEKELANPLSGSKVAYKAHAGRGPEAKWEIQNQTVN